MAALPSALIQQFKIRAYISLQLILLILPAVRASTQSRGSRIQPNRLEVMKPSALPVSWIPIETHGLMLSHYPPSFSSFGGDPIISGGDDETSVFASTLNGLTSSHENFVAWDDELVNDLSETPWRRRSPGHSIGSRDIVQRSAFMHLSQRPKGAAYMQLGVFDTAHQARPRESYWSSPKPSSNRLIARRVTSSKRSHKPKPSQENALDPLFGQNPTDLNVMKGATIPVKITWYTGHDLLNPYCVRQSKWAPTDSSMVIAVTQTWSTRPACGDFYELKVVDQHSGQTGKSVIARVVDLCGGCKPEVPHADLSKAAFTHLFNLDVGVVSGLAMRKVSPPKNWNEKLYGPRLL